MEITVVGRHAEISSRFRAYAEEKVSKVTQYDPRATPVWQTLLSELSSR